MSNIVESSNIDAAKGLLNNPHHPYWDKAPTRREVMGLIKALVDVNKELSDRADTMYLVINLLCELGNITKGQIDAYVAQKAAEVNTFRENLALAQKELREKVDIQEQEA